jgi:hypothetical protein
MKSARSVAETTRRDRAWCYCLFGTGINLAGDLQQKECDSIGAVINIIGAQQWVIWGGDFIKGESADRDEHSRSRMVTSPPT